MATQHLWSGPLIRDEKNTQRIGKALSSTTDGVWKSMRFMTKCCLRAWDNLHFENMSGKGTTSEGEGV